MHFGLGSLTFLPNTIILGNSTLLLPYSSICFFAQTFVQSNQAIGEKILQMFN